MHFFYLSKPGTPFEQPSRVTLVQHHHFDLGRSKASVSSREGSVCFGYSSASSQKRTLHFFGRKFLLDCQFVLQTAELVGESCK